MKKMFLLIENKNQNTHNIDFLRYQAQIYIKNRKKHMYSK